MADQKLSALTELSTEPPDASIVYIVSGGTSYKCTWATVKSYIGIVSEFDNLDDVDLTGRSDGMFPYYDLSGDKLLFKTLAISDVASLQTALDAKADSSHNHDLVYAAISHTHAWSEIVSGVPTTLAGYGIPTSEIEIAYSTEVAQVSEAEKTAGTETAVRRFSPDDIKDMIATHETGGGGSGGMTVVATKTANYTASANEVVPVDSSGGAFTITLPASPSTQDRVIIVDVGKACATNNVTVARNGNTIDGNAEDFIIDLDNGRVDAFFDGTSDWETHVIAPSAGGSGTVTSVAMTVPTGLEVAGTPITESGTFAVTLAIGYSIPTTVKQGEWDTAYGWGNHASAGYAVSGGAEHDGFSDYVAEEHIRWDQTGAEDLHVDRMPASVQLQFSGFLDRDDSVITIVDGTRTVSITPAVTSFQYWQNHTLYTVSSADSIVISDVEGLHFIYYNGATLSETTTFSEDLIYTYALVAVVYWDATNNESVILADERHGYLMDPDTHSYNHQTIGARYASGLELGNINTAGTGGAAGDAQFSVASGVMWDEDIKITITDGSPQTLSTAAEIPIAYRSGANGDWRLETATTYPVAVGATPLIQWNEWTGTVWQLTEASSGNYVLYHYFATGDFRHPIIGIPGLAEYASLAAAQAAAPSEIHQLAFGPLESLTPEIIAIATVIYETKTSFTNAVQARTRPTEDGSDYIDWRGVASGGGGTGAGSLVDPNAIHVNAGNEFTGVTAKGTPVAADVLLIEDSAASFIKKSIVISDIPVLWSQVGTTPTTLSGYGISDTKANFNAALSDGSFMFVGDAPTAHTHTYADLPTVTAYHLIGRNNASNGDMDEFKISDLAATIPISGSILAETTGGAFYRIPVTTFIAPSLSSLADGDMLVYRTSPSTGWVNESMLETIIVAISDQTTDLTTGTAKETFRMPYAFTVTEVRASVTTAPVGSTIQVDINESGTSILSTVISIDASEKTSETAATAPVISDSSLADDAEITIDIDQVGSSTAGAGLKVYLIGRRQ